MSQEQHQPIEMDFAIKAVTASYTEGEPLFIEGYAALFDDAPDRQGESVGKAAFSQVMQRYMQNPIVYLGHDDSNEDNAIGSVVDYRIDDRGLWIKARISPAAKTAYDKIKDGVYRTFSWKGYVKRAVTKAGRKIMEVTDLYHIAVVGTPARHEAQFTLAAKSASFQLYTSSNPSAAGQGEGMGVKDAHQKRKLTKRSRALITELRKLLAELENTYDVDSEETEDE